MVNIVLGVDTGIEHPWHCASYCVVYVEPKDYYLNYKGKDMLNSKRSNLVLTRRVVVVCGVFIL